MRCSVRLKLAVKLCRHLEVEGLQITRCRLRVLAQPGQLLVKVSLNRIQFDRPLQQFVAEQLLASGISLLPIEFRHVMRVAQFPFHHRDPFDRLLAAQALEERLTLISADPALDAYGPIRLW